MRLCKDLEVTVKGVFNLHFLGYAKIIFQGYLFKDRGNTLEVNITIILRV